MPLQLTVKRGYTCVAGVPISYASLNAGFLPIITLEGSVANTDLGSGAVTASKVTPDAYWYAVDSDVTGNLIVATYSPAPTALTDGLVLAVKVKGQNTAAVTFNPNSLGAKKLLKYHDQELAAGDLEDNMIIEMRYDSLGDTGNGAWQLLTPVATVYDANAGTVPIQTIIDKKSGVDIPVPTEGTVATIPHGLVGKIPAWVRVVLVCTVTPGPTDGYSLNDEVDITALIADGTASELDWAAFTVSADATNVTVSATDGRDGISYNAKAGGRAAFDESKWKLKVYILSV